MLFYGRRTGFSDLRPLRAGMIAKGVLFITAAMLVALAVAHVALAEDPDDPAGGEGSKQVIEVGTNDRVTMHVKDLPLMDALRMLADPAKRNVVVSGGENAVVNVSLYGVSFEDALDAIVASNGFGYRTEGNFIYVYPQEELDSILAARRQVASRVFKLTYINAAAVQKVIEPMLSNAGKLAVTPPAQSGLGGESGVSDTSGDALATSDVIIVTDYVDRLDAIAAVLKDIDVRPAQVLIEATILRASLTEENALGIDFTTVGGIDFTTLSSTSPAAQSITTGATPQALLGDTTFTARTDFNSAIADGGFTFGIIKDQVGLFIRALEDITDTEILANPKVLALNKQIGQVLVGRRDGYFTTIVTETTATQTVEFLETGTILTFRPFIGNDGYVRMEIHPKDSTGGLNDAGLPIEQTTEVTSNILVRDGHTILIGGLFREVSTGTRGQVPGLGNIPVAGALFRRTGDTTVREEVIILLTVHIIKSDEKENEAGREMREDVERIRVGLRKGLQWFGRERLGQAHYRWALQHLENGDIHRAIWDANLALHIFPGHLNALKLKEKLLNQRAWEDESSSVRSYVMDRIMEEAGVVKPAFGRPGPPFTIPEEIEGPSGLEENGDVDTPASHFTGDVLEGATDDAGRMQ